MARQSHHKGEDVSYLVIYDKDKDTWRIKPRALDIVWGGDPRYWKLSREEGPAELLQVSWLEVSGKISLSDLAFKEGKEYMLNFRVELRPDNFGWADCPVYCMVRVGKEKRLWKKTHLRSSPGEAFDVPIDSRLTFRVPLGSTGADDKIVFGMYEIWRGKWKGGLVIHEVIIAHASRYA